MTKKPETDEEMAAIRVSGAVSPHNAQIYLAPYDPAWPAQYEAEAAKIRAALGDRALALEHVGSTSIPGLAPSRSSTSSCASPTRPTKTPTSLPSPARATGCTCANLSGSSTGS